MNCIVCNKSLEENIQVIKYEKTFLCKSCFESLLEKAENKLEFLWIALRSNTSIMMSSFLKTLATPILISKEKVILEFSSDNMAKQFELKKPLLIEALNVIFSDNNNEREIIININSKREKFKEQTIVDECDSIENVEINVENIISHFLDTVTFNDIWGNTVKINEFRRRDFVFIEGYYSSLKILLKIAKDEIPNAEKYLNEVDERKDILINPIMLLCHFFIELSLKRYIIKLSNMAEFGHDKLNLFDILENLWNKKTSELTDEYWLKHSFLQGYSITNRFKTVREIVYNFYKLDPKSLTFRYCNVELNEQNIMIDVNAVESDIDLLYDFFEDLNIAISKL